MPSRSPRRWRSLRSRRRGRASSGSHPNVNRTSTAVARDDLWEMIDTDNDGHISKTEFAAMYSAVKEAVLREHEGRRGLRRARALAARVSSAPRRASSSSLSLC